MNDIRKGKIVVMGGQPFVVNSADFLKKQQRRPVMRCVLKNLRTGATKEHTFAQSDRIEEADIRNEEWQYLYADQGRHMFMNQKTYEQVELGEDVVGEDTAKFLLEGQEVTVMLFEGKPAGVELPIKIERTVASAPPGVKGNTSTNVMKDVVLEGGAKVKAPLFVKDGDKIVIDTRTGSYVSKA